MDRAEQQENTQKDFGFPRHGQLFDKAGTHL